MRPPLAQRFNRLLDWAKIDSETFKSGALKDAGNPTREPRSLCTSAAESIVES